MKLSNTKNICQAPTTHITNTQTQNSISTKQVYNFLIEEEGELEEGGKEKMEGCRRPDRSDNHLSPEEEAAIEAEARQYFDGVVPKRHTKPQRSEYSSQYVDDCSSNNSIPEMVEFQRLENDPHEKVSSKTKYLFFKNFTIL